MKNRKVRLNDAYNWAQQRLPCHNTNEEWNTVWQAKGVWKGEGKGWSGWKRLLEFLLDAELVGVAAFLLSAVDGTRMETSVALSAYFLLTVELLGQLSQRRLDHSTSQSQHQV